MRIYALIPARAGSKGVPGKNIRLIAGHPLVAYSIAAARLCPSIERVIVSTDSPQIAEVCRDYGAEVPFLRPAEISGDGATDCEFVRHAIDWFERVDGFPPDAFVHLRPTSPLRDPAVVAAGVAAFQADHRATSLRSVHLALHPPFKWFRLGDTGYLDPLFSCPEQPGYTNLPRQSYPPVYVPNGYVDVIRTSFIKGAADIHGPETLAFITHAVPDLDTVLDFDDLERRADVRLSDLIAGCMDLEVSELS